jgi:hypothetical protein
MRSSGVETYLEKENRVPERSRGAVTKLAGRKTAVQPLIRMSNIKLFESKKIRTEWSEQEQKWYFSFQDVVEVLTDSADVKQYMKRMLSRMSCVKATGVQFVPWLK